MKKTYFSLDLGGTFAKFGLVTDQGEILKRGTFAVRSERGPDPILRDIISCFRDIKNGLSPDLRPCGLSVGVAGVVRPEEGILATAPNLPGWKNMPLAGILSQALMMEVRIENDANLFILGEWLAGAGRGFKNLVGLTLGTGVGGGLILDGRLWRGNFGSAAEIGHMIIEPDGRKCSCGSRGCLETLASATAVTRFAREAMAKGRPCAYQGPPEDITAKDLHDLALREDPLAIEAFEKAGWALGLGLTSIFNILGIEAAILGGGVSMAMDFIEPRLMLELSSRVLTVDPDEIRVSRAALGNDAALLGAPAMFEDCPF